MNSSQHLTNHFLGFLISVIILNSFFWCLFGSRAARTACFCHLKNRSSSQLSIHNYRKSKLSVAHSANKRSSTLLARRYQYNRVRSVYLRVCLLVRKVCCGKTADWIRMPFGMVSVVGRWIGVLDGW